MLHAAFIFMVIFWLFPAPIVAWLMWESGYSINLIFLAVMGVSLIDVLLSSGGAYFLDKKKKARKNTIQTVAGPSAVVFVVTVLLYLGLHIYLDLSLLFK